MAMKILRHSEKSCSVMAVDCYEIVLDVLDRVFVEVETKEAAAMRVESLVETNCNCSVMSSSTYVVMNIVHKIFLSEKVQIVV
jgi:hypothetical protein